MIELQDKAFTAKEKKSRDRAIKRSKRTGKEMAILKVNGLFSHTLVFDKKFKLPEHQLTGFEDLRNNGNSFEVASCLRSLKILELNEFDCVICKTQHSSKKNSKGEKEDRKEVTASVSSSAVRSQSMKSKGRSGEQNDEADSVIVKGVGRDATVLGKNKINNGIVNVGDPKEEFAKGEGKSSSGPSISTKFENSKPSWAEIIKKNQCPIEGNGAQSLAEQRIREDAVNMGLGIKDVSVELDKNKSKDQVSVGSKEDINPDGHSQQGHIREIDEEVSSEEDRVSEYEEAFLEKKNIGRLSKNQKKKEQRFRSLSEIQDKAKEDLVLSGSNRNVSDHIAILLGDRTEYSRGQATKEKPPDIVEESQSCIEGLE
ncbi:hypothetical protein V6N11_021225 [Hibiscus sabdariffa]|uniref:Uncharacterized protein n=1 Tax=Hibiscus sabdariffa TaxID=183260 RepID=A0ABR2NLU5_9ROSI